MEIAGVAVDRGVLAALSKEFDGRLAGLEAKIHEAAGEPFNIGSPLQLGRILFEKLALSRRRRRPRRRSRGRRAPTCSRSSRRSRPGPVPAPRPRVARDLEAQGHVRRRAARVAIADGRAHPHALRPGRRRDGPPLLERAEPAEHPDPHGGGPRDPPRVRRAAREACSSPPTTRRSSCASSRTSRATRRSLEAFRRGEDIHRATAAKIFGDRAGRRHGGPEARARRRSTSASSTAWGRSRSPRSSASRAPRRRRSSPPTSTASRGSARASTRSSRRRARRAARRRSSAACARSPASHDRNHNVRANAERMAMNAPFQGSAADLIKIAMLALDAALATELPEARLLLQVHDELVLEAPGGPRPEGRGGARAPHDGRRGEPAACRSRWTSEPAATGRRRSNRAEALESRHAEAPRVSSAPPRSRRAGVAARAERGRCRPVEPLPDPVRPAPAEVAVRPPALRRAGRAAEGSRAPESVDLEYARSARALGPRPRDGEGERDRRRRAAAQGVSRRRSPASRRAGDSRRRRRAASPSSTWATVSSISPSRSRRPSSAPSARAAAQGRPARRGLPRDRRATTWMARYPAAIDPKDPEAVSVEELDALPVAEKTPWSFDATRQRAHLTALVEVSAQGTVSRVLPTGDAEPLLVRWLRQSAAKWKLAPGLSGGAPVASLDDARRDARLHARFGEEEGRAQHQEEPARDAYSTFLRSPDAARLLLRVEVLEERDERLAREAEEVAEARDGERLPFHALELLLGGGRDVPWTTRSGESRTRRPDFTRCETSPSTTCGFVPSGFAASAFFGGSKPALR